MAAWCPRNWWRPRDLRLLSPVLLPVALLTLGGCWSSPQDASPESQFLQETAIPAMTRWAGTASEILPLARLISSQGFDRLCTLPEYENLAVLETEVPIARYRGHVSDVVPENKIAVVGVTGDTAHVAYIRHRELGLFIQGRHCYDAQRIMLRRSHDPQMYSPGAFLVEGSAGG